MSKICLVCGDGELSDLRDCDEKSFDRIKEFTNLWHQLDRYDELYEKLTNLSWSPQQFYRHIKCYNAVTHSGNLKKNQKNHLKNSKTQNSYELALCFLCQDTDKGKASTVSTTKVAQEILELQMKGSHEVKTRLAAFTDITTILNKIKYHSNCLITEKRKFLAEAPIQPEDKYARVNIEFLKSVKLQLTSLDADSPTVDMKELVDLYGKFTETAKLPSPVVTMRRYVKTLLESDEELMAKIDFYHFEPCKPTVVANKLLVSKLICGKHFQKDCVDESMTMKVVNDIRKELSSAKEWEFDGSFEDFETPQKLVNLLKLIISGSYTLSDKKQDEVNVVSKNISQYICSNFKSNRQLTYHSSKGRGFEKHRLTPLSVGTALVNYQANRSKTEIDKLSRMGLCINYDKLERTITALAVSLIKEASRNGLGIILPPSIKKGIRPIFAADNIDFGSDSKSFHGADLMIVQRNEENHESLFPKYNFQPESQERSLNYSIAPQIDENVELTTGNNSTYECSIAVSNASQYWLEFQQLNVIWLLLSSLKMIPTDDKNNKALSWSAFHSKMSTSPDILSNVAIVAPLYRRSPTEVPVLIDILKRAMNISVLTVGPNKRAVVTLDGDLYKDAVKVPNYKEKWIIRLGSLHTIIAALKCLGKYIEGSGIDTAWEMCGMYGSMTVNQIIDGRHIYRGIQAHTVTLLALHYLYTQSILTTEDQETIQEISSVISDSSQDKDEFQNSVLNVKQKLMDSGVLDKLNMVGSSPTATFLCNYMRQVMNLLNYIGATRLRNWMQHLATKDDMSKYFHAHDQSNYLKWVLLYIADMLELQTTDPESWKFFEDGNFTVSKNEVPFTSIDPDHAIEHEHRPMKMKGGFVNITNNESALDRYVLTLPILSQMSADYKRYSNIKVNDEKAKIHHELYGNFFANQLSSSQKLINELSSEGNPFNYSDLRNLMNFSVPRDSICSNILKRDVLGEESVAAFRKERMMKDSKINFWSHYPRKNYKMFSDKEIIVPKVKNVVTTLREEKILHSRMTIISRTRPELCPQKVIGEYELTNIPPSNFEPDGTLIVAKSNETLIDLLSEIQVPTAPMQNDLMQNGTIIIIDGMDILDQLKTVKPMMNVGHLVNAFMSKLISDLNCVSQDYTEFRLLFTRFVSNSLKESREKCKTLKKAVIRYHVTEKTPIKKLEIFLAHIDTRAELTEFLGRKVLERFADSEIRIVVGYGSKFYSNDSHNRSHILNQEHNLDDMSQLILLNCVDLNNNGVQSVFVKSMSIDVIVLLIGHKNLIPHYTNIIRCGNTIKIDDFYNRIGVHLSQALVGWYTMQGMAYQGAFYGKGIKSHFKALLKCDEEILNAFSKFGDTPFVSEEILLQMERYISLLYGNSCGKKIQDIRFSMSVIDGRESKNLPPTVGTLIPHVFRAFYSALISKLAITLCPEIPPPTDYYWVHSSDDTFQPVMCIKDALPEALLEFKQCKCKAKTNRCTMLSCTCVKNGLKCTELCKCGDQCKNMAVEEVIWEEGNEEVGWDRFL